MFQHNVMTRLNDLHDSTGGVRHLYVPDSSAEKRSASRTPVHNIYPAMMVASGRGTSVPVFGRECGFCLELRPGLASGSGRGTSIVDAMKRELELDCECS